MKFSQLHKKTKLLIIAVFLSFNLIFGFLTSLVFYKIFPKEQIQNISMDKKKIEIKKEKKIPEVKKEVKEIVSKPKDENKPKKTNKIKKSEDDFITNTYSVGQDLPPGVYKVTSIDSESSFYLISDIKDKDKVDFYNGVVFFNFTYVQLKDGDHLHLLDSKLLKEEENKPYEPKDNIYISGQYKVGYDIPSGSYNIKPKGQVGHIEISTTPSNKDNIFNEYIEKPLNIKVKDGEFLTISMTEVELAKE